jgi:hypothetical protein
MVHKFWLALYSGVGLWVLRPLLAYCTSPGWLGEGDCGEIGGKKLAGETEVLRENLPQRHLYSAVAFYANFK